MSALTVTIQRQGDPSPGEPREFTAGPVEIGRHPENDLVLPESTVSRKHARFELRGDGFWHLVDLGSAHGTYLNKQRVHDVMVPSRCEVYVNPFVLRVSVARSAPPPTPAPATGPGEGSTVMEVSGRTPPAPAPVQPVGTILDFEGSTPPAPAPRAPTPAQTFALEIDEATADADTNVESARPEASAPTPRPPAAPTEGGPRRTGGPASRREDAGARAEPAGPDMGRSPSRPVSGGGERSGPPPAEIDEVVGTLFEMDAGKMREGIATHRARKAAERGTPAPAAPAPKPASPPPAALDSLPPLDPTKAVLDSLPPLDTPRAPEALQTLPTADAAGGTGTGTVFEVAASEVRGRTPPAPTPAPGRSPTPRSSTPPARPTGATPPPRAVAGPLPPTRMHRGGPKAGAAQRAPEALRDLAPDLQSGRDHGRLLGILLGVAMSVLAILGAQGGGAGTDLTLLVAVLAGGVAALAAAWLVADPVVRGAVLLAAGAVPLGVLLAGAPPALADVGELAAAGPTDGPPAPGGRTSLFAAAWLLRGARPWLLWLGAAGLIALLGAVRTARLWPESLAPRLLGPAGGAALLAIWLVPLPLPPSGFAVLPAGRLLAIGLHARPPAELVALGLPLAGLCGLALVAGVRLRPLTWLAPALVALALCWPALAHVSLSGVRFRVLTQAGLAVLPAPLFFLAAVGLAALLMGVLTARRPDARELLERL